MPLLNHQISISPWLRVWRVFILIYILLEAEALNTLHFLLNEVQDFHVFPCFLFAPFEEQIGGSIRIGIHRIPQVSLLKSLKISLVEITGVLESLRTKQLPWGLGPGHNGLLLNGQFNHCSHQQSQGHQCVRHSAGIILERESDVLESSFFLGEIIPTFIRFFANGKNLLLSQLFFSRSELEAHFEIHPMFPDPGCTSTRFGLCGDTSENRRSQPSWPTGSFLVGAVAYS